MKKILITLLMAMPLLAAAQDNTWERIETTPAGSTNPDAKYLVENAVPMVDGKVCWKTTINAPGKSAQQVYDILLAQLNKMVNEENQLMERSKVAIQDQATHQLGATFHEWLVFKNTALFNTGDIGNSMYDYDDKGMTPTPSDSLKVHMANTASPIIYLHHGMTNFAYHYCMEIQVEYGSSGDSICIGCNVVDTVRLPVFSRFVFVIQGRQLHGPGVVVHLDKVFETSAEVADIDRAARISLDICSHIRIMEGTGK